MKVLSDGLSRGYGDEKVWPPGFRFHPTDEELVLYYLKRKICGRKIKSDIIGDIDVYKWDPEELPGLSLIKTGDRQWFFFSPRDRKYPNGARSNRATRHGYWKATGKDRTVKCDSRDVGVKKTLVFYKGRAPNGERSDWVMHEYTLDEKELNRCTNVQNYYALYKVFKKSGAGPKNGEQYGAVFKEEDWAEVDDEVCGFNNSDDREITIEKSNDVTAVSEEPETCPTLFSLDDLEDLMKHIPDEALFELPEGQEADPYANTLPLVVGQEESVSTLVELDSPNHIIPRSIVVPHTTTLSNNVPESLEFNESTTFQQQSFESPEATSSCGFSKPANMVFEDDFLEIDDLGGPDFTLSSVEKSFGSSQFGELTGLYDLDQFHDAAMFLNDLGPIDYGTTNMYSNQSADNSENLLDNQFQFNLDCTDVNQINNPTQMHDQMELQHNSVTQQNSGVLYDPSNNTSGTNRNQVSNEDGSAAPAGQISSALWAFVESIPTTPASAAENAQLSRTFDQMSSFGRMIGGKNSTVSGIDSSSSSSSSSSISLSRKGGFFVFSVLGGLCAILWVFIGAIRLWGRCISL